MDFLYWFSLVLGGGLFAVSLAGDFFGGAHADVDGGVDGGVGGVDGGAHGDVSSDAHGHGDDFQWSKLLSIRNLTYFLFAFGAAGVLLPLVSGDNALLTAVGALFTGFVAWSISALAFGYLRRTESGALVSDYTLVGKIGEVSLPLLAGRDGKVMVTRGGQLQELLARPLNPADPEPEKWHTIVVVDVRDGVALVTPYTEGKE